MFYFIEHGLYKNDSRLYSFSVGRSVCATTAIQQAPYSYYDAVFVVYCARAQYKELFILRDVILQGRDISYAGSGITGLRSELETTGSGLSVKASFQ